MTMNHCTDILNAQVPLQEVTTAFDEDFCSTQLFGHCACVVKSGDAKIDTQVRIVTQLSLYCKT